MRDVLLAEGTVRLLRQACKRMGLVGACAPWLGGVGWPLSTSNARAGPSPTQHAKQPQESQDHQLVVKLV
jgi:hypothetical protein